MSILIDKSTRLWCRVSQAGNGVFHAKKWLNTEQMWWAWNITPAKEDND